jgi:hypothetical protein
LFLTKNIQRLPEFSRHKDKDIFPELEPRIKIAGIKMEPRIKMAGIKTAAQAALTRLLHTNI